jgi:hypothetical protein
MQMHRILEKLHQMRRGRGLPRVLQPEAIADIRFWNEQYLVEAMLTHSTKFEVIAALNFLKNARYDDLKGVCPYLTPDREPGSFYIRVRA